MLSRDPFEAALLAEQSPSPPQSPPKSIEKKEGENEEDNEEGNIDDYISSGGDNAEGMARIQQIVSQFTEEQMNRYEIFRRSGFKKSKMIKLLAGILGTQKISDHITITVSALAKMFVGDLVETARIIMTERNDKGPIRPCHIREAYRKLKLEGKIPRKSSKAQFFH